MRLHRRLSVLVLLITKKRQILGDPFMVAAFVWRIHPIGKCKGPSRVCGAASVHCRSPLQKPTAGVHPTEPSRQCLWVTLPPLLVPVSACGVPVECL